MRTRGLMSISLTLAAAAAGCGSSTLGPGVDSGSGDGSASMLVCPVALGDCAASPPTGAAGYCTVDMGIQSACAPCGSQSCTLTGGALVHGATYTYVQLLNVDVAFIYVYDHGGALVAELEWSASGSAAGQGWGCFFGPATFDASEATSLLPVTSGNGLNGTCPPAAF